MELSEFGKEWMKMASNKNRLIGGQIDLVSKAEKTMGLGGTKMKMADPGGAKEKSADPSSLMEHAASARRNAYAPYSRFAVGAAVSTELGIFTGCNVENASYPAGICAERAAICNAINAGAKAFYGIAVAGGAMDMDVPEHCPPCGICRQFMAELFPENAPVAYSGCEGAVERTTVGALLPGGFQRIHLTPGR